MRFLRRLKYEIYELLETLFSIVPGTMGKYLRQMFYNGFFKKCGKNLNVGLRVKIQVPGNIYIGENVGLNYGVWMAANYHEEGKIIIGNNVLIGPYTIMHSGNHNYKNTALPINKQGFNFSIITIEEDVWIAARCTILSGVTIGKSSIIAAGSVITKDVPPFSVVAGVPGKIISTRIE